MKVYIEAYYLDGTRKLGNLDGQGVITAKNYRRTKHYKMLSTFPTLNSCIAFYTVVSTDGKALETIQNETFKK